MDTVSMLNKMSFYCQPILPLVYDESMSYYETLCKVVGQLNTTGETVNKLNEGLTGEIADRQSADAELDARIKEIEKTNKKIHFLKVDTLGHLLTENVTREKLSQWVQDGDIIAMLYAPDEQENSWAVATNYRCLGARGAETMQLKFYVPISVTNNAGKSGMDVAQEVVVISLPVGALTNQWTVRSITSTIPNTNADGFVNLTATVGDAGAVTCDVEPGAIVEALRNYFSGTNQYAVAVNARLTYDGKQYHSASAIVKADASGSGNIRITFENYYNGVRAENGVRQMDIETIFLVGDAQTNVWSVETIDNKAFDFSRYEGFQFTRGAHNVITANDESTPNAVYIQYHSDTSGKIYQNLPVHLVDTVDNAEYWNGVFDIKDDKHMTFTFVVSNYVTASDKMPVRIIELSADVNTTTWKYAEKEFTLPLAGGGASDFIISGALTETTGLTLDKTFDQIQEAIRGGKLPIIRLEAEVSTITLPIVSNNTRIIMFSGSYSADGQIMSISVMVTNRGADYISVTTPATNPNGTMKQISMGDNPTMDMQIATKKYVDDHSVTVDTAMSDTSTNPVQNKVVKAALDGKASTEVASQTANGLMSKEDKTKLDGVAEGANKTTVIDALDPLSHNPVSSAALFEALSNKANKTEATEQTAGLMSALDKKKLNGIEDEANKTIVDEMLSDSSTNPVQNKAITAALASVVRETIYQITVTATSAEWAVNNGIAYKEATADRTFDNIKAAYNANKTPVCEFDGMTYSLVLDSSTEFVFASYRGAVANDLQYAGLGKYPASLITINTTGVVISRTAGDLPAVGGTDNGKMLIVSGGEWALQSVAGTTVDAELSTTSENPVQNKTVTDALNDKLPRTGGTVTGALRTNDSFSAGGTISFGEAPIVLSQTDDGAAKILYGSADVNDNPPPLSRLKVARPTADDDAATKKYVDGRNDSPQFKGYVTLTPANAPIGTGVGLSPSGSGNDFTLDISDVNEDTPTLLTGVKTPTDADTNAAATVEYVNNKVAGAPITITLGTGNAATSTATFAEIKAALEAGKAPILDSATGTNHWFALNWTLSGSGSLSIQYGTFNVEGGGMANFTFYDVAVSSTGITYFSREFTSQ